MVLPQLDDPFTSVDERGGGGTADRRDDRGPVAAMDRLGDSQYGAAVAVAGNLLDLGLAAQAVVGVAGLSFHAEGVFGFEQRGGGCACGVVGGELLGLQTSFVVEGVSQQAPAVRSGILGLARAQETVVEDVGGALDAVVAEGLGAYRNRLAIGDGVGELVGRSLAGEPVGQPHLGRSPQGVVCEVNSVVVGVDLLLGQAAEDVLDGGRGLSGGRIARLGRRRGHLHGGGEAGCGGVLGRGGTTVSARSAREYASVGDGHIGGQIGAGQLPTVGIVGGSGFQIDGGSAVVLLQHRAGCRVPLRGDGIVCTTVVGSAHVGHYVRGAADARTAGLGHLLLPGRKSEDVVGGVGGIGGARTDVVGGGADITPVVDLSDPPGHCVELVVGFGDTPLRAGPVVQGRPRLAALGSGEVGGDGSPAADLLRGLVMPRPVDRLGQDLAAGTGVADGLVGEAGRGLVVGDRVALSVLQGYGHGLRSTAGVLAVAVHAAQEVGVLLRLHRRGATLATGLHTNLSVATPLRPGLELLLGQTVVIVVVPGRTTQVLVGGDLIRCPAGTVGGGDRGDYVLVEPLPFGIVRCAAADVLREAACGVGLRRRQRVPVTGRCRVVDVDLAAGFICDCGQTSLDERRIAITGLVEAVDQLGVGEGRLRQADRRGCGVTGALDGVQQQLVIGVRHAPAVGQLPGVDVLVGAAVVDLGGHLGEPLAGEERRGEAALVTVLVRVAVQVPGRVVPVGGVLVDVRAGGGRVGQTALGIGETDSGQCLGVVYRGGLQAVLDAVEGAAAYVAGVVLGLQVAAVGVGLLVVVVGDGVAVRVDDIVEVPSPGLLAPGIGERRGVAGLAGVVAEDGDGPGGVCGRFAVRPARQPVVAEVVAGAVRVGQTPVLAVVVTVAAAAGYQTIDPGAVVVLQLPRVGPIGNQLAALAVEGEEGVVVCPAKVARLIAVGVLHTVVSAGLVLALDETGPQVEAVPHPGCLIVGVAGTPVDGPRRVRQLDRGSQAAGDVRHLHVVRPDEVTCVQTGFPGRRW
ncbi:hypothetical protein STXM2123_4984 [Streptomyces sp. F-3]|nr:hypothetical protein STXM2123_4984 [Streptomyces sp. F-3]